MPSLRAISKEEVAAHSSLSDGWIVVDGWVVDASALSALHPGGPQVLAPYLGGSSDAGLIFRSPESHVHSAAALRLLAQLRVGYLEGRKSAEALAHAEKTAPRTAEEYGVDLSKGLLWQTASLGSRYSAFVHDVLILHSETLRYFDSPLLEAFSHSSWYYVPLVWIPMVMLCLWAALVHYKLQAGWPMLMLYLLVLGPLVWGLTEYVLHRIVFHMDTMSFTWNYLHFLLHGYHHIAPMDHGRLTFPPLPAAILGTPVYLLIRTLCGPAHGTALFAGVIFGYMVYDLTHYYLHHAPRSLLLRPHRWLKTHHLYHHYKNEQRNFGISSPLFDVVFSTLENQRYKAD